nr:MAG TPA: hypothetical protein [Caudoviricetes sp.]
MAKKTKKRQSAKQQAINKAYAKERNHVKSFVRRAEKRGYIFPESIIPSIPKRKTEASIRKLKKLTKEMLYSKASYGGEATFGEIVSGKEGLKLERQLRAKRAAKTRKEKKEAEQRFWTSTDGTKTPVTDEPALAYAEAFNDLVDKLKEIISTMDVYYYVSVTGKRVRRMPNVAEIANSALNEILATLDGVVADIGYGIIKTLPKELQQSFNVTEVGKNKVGQELSKQWDDIQKWLGVIHYDSDANLVWASAQHIIALLSNISGFTLSESAMRSFEDLDDMMDGDY